MGARKGKSNCAVRTFPALSVSQSRRGMLPERGAEENPPSEGATGGKSDDVFGQFCAPSQPH